MPSTPPHPILTANSDRIHTLQPCVLAPPQLSAERLGRQQPPLRAIVPVGSPAELKAMWDNLPPAAAAALEVCRRNPQLLAPWKPIAVDRQGCAGLVSKIHQFGIFIASLCRRNVSLQQGFGFVVKPVKPWELIERVSAAAAAAALAVAVPAGGELPARAAGARGGAQRQRHDERTPSELLAEGSGAGGNGSHTGLGAAIAAVAAGAALGAAAVAATPAAATGLGIAATAAAMVSLSAGQHQAADVIGGGPTSPFPIADAQTEAAAAIAAMPPGNRLREPNGGAAAAMPQRHLSEAEWKERAALGAVDVASRMFAEAAMSAIASAAPPSVARPPASQQHKPFTTEAAPAASAEPSAAPPAAHAQGAHAVGGAGSAAAHTNGNRHATPHSGPAAAVLPQQSTAKPAALPAPFSGGRSAPLSTPAGAGLTPEETIFLRGLKILVRRCFLQAALCGGAVVLCCASRLAVAVLPRAHAGETEVSDTLSPTRMRPRDRRRKTTSRTRRSSLQSSGSTWTRLSSSPTTAWRALRRQSGSTTTSS